MHDTKIIQKNVWALFCVPTLCLILGTVGTYIKCAYFFRHKFYKLHLFHFSTYLVSKDENHLYIKSVFLKVVHKNDKKINFFTCVAIEHFFRSSFRFSPCLQLISPYLIKSYQNLLFYHAYCLSVSWCYTFYGSSQLSYLSYLFHFLPMYPWFTFFRSSFRLF